MPIYEYICNNCGHKFEQIRSMNEVDKACECAYCKSQDTRRLLSVCYAKSGGKLLAGSSSGCEGCGGGHCGNCNH